MMEKEEVVLMGLIRFLMNNDVELVLVNDRVTLRRYDSSLNLLDINVDLHDWILGE